MILIYLQNAVNWVSSNKPLDTVIDDRGYDCKRVSAGMRMWEWVETKTCIDLNRNQKAVESHRFQQLDAFVCQVWLIEE